MQNPGHRRTLKDAELGARALNLWFETVSAQTPEELDGAIKTAAKTRTSALFIMTDAMFNTRVSRIAQLTIKNRLPSVYDRNEFVESGGLMSYGTNLAESSRRAAEYVDKILKGARPVI